MEYHSQELNVIILDLVFIYRCKKYSWKIKIIFNFYLYRNALRTLGTLQKNTKLFVTVGKG